MAKKKFAFSNILKNFLNIMEFSKTNSSFSFYPCFMILIYFIHIFSYILKFKWYYEEEKLNFLASAIFYLNFPNGLLFFKSYSLILLFYILVVFFSFYFYIYLLILTIFSKYIQRKPILVRIFRIFNGVFASLFRAHYWIFLLPCLEMLINPLFCNVRGSYCSCEEKLGVPFIVLSMISIILNIILGVAYLLIYKSYTYLDLNEIKPNSTFLSIICFIIRVCLPLIFPIFGENYPFLYYVFLLIIGFASLIDNLFSMAIRSPIFNKFYLMCLFFFLMSSIIFTITTFTDVLIEESLFVLIWLVSIIAMKFGMSAFFKIRFKYISKDLQYHRFLYISLEEISLFFNNHKTSLFDYYMLLGMLKNHAKKCKDDKCKFRNKHMNEYENLRVNQQGQRISSFIAQTFKKEITNIKKKNNSLQTETLILKYFSFLVESNENISKTLFEFKKISCLNLQKSYITGIILKIITKKIHKKFKEIEKERKISQRKQDDERSLDTNTFFSMNKQRNSFESQMKKLLQEKIVFWEHYKEGFNSYEEIIRELYSLIKNVFILEKKLNKSILKTSKDNLITLKFYSIFYCIALNQIHKANKVEDDVENIRKRYVKTNRNSLSPLSFLQDNIITCEASFLNHNGLILEKAKTQKLAQFFGYSVEEMKNLRYINELMPEMISEKHHSFFLWSFTKTRKDLIYDQQQIVTYSIDKNKFVFPIKIFLGHSLQYYQDYVIHAAIMKTEISEGECVLFEKTGLISGCTLNFLNIFREVYPNIVLEDIKMLNIYCLIPKLTEILNNNQIFESDSSVSLKNLNSTCIFPRNLLEIIEFLKFQKDDEQKENKFNSFISSVRSAKSFKTLNSKKTEKTQVQTKLNSFFSRYNKKFTNGSLNSKKEFLYQMLESDKQEGNQNLIDRLIEWTDLKKRRLNFDLTFIFYRYGKSQKEVLCVGWLKSNNFGIIEIETEENLGNITSKNEQVRPLDSPNISSLKGIELPPQNEARFDFEFEREKANSFFSEEAQKQKIIDALSKRSLEKNDQGKNNETTEPNPNFFTLQLSKTNIPPSKAIAITMPAKPYDIENKKSSKLSIDSSISKEKEKIRLEDLKGQTTDKDNMIVHMEAESQKASSVSTLKRSYTIFATIKMIQDKLPKSIFLVIFSLIFQIMLIFSYCLIIFFFATSYVTNQYEPLQQASINQCKTNIGIGISALVINEYDFVIRNYRTLSDFQSKELRRILNISYHNAKNIFYNDRVTDYAFDFNTYLLNYEVSYVDFRNPSVTSTILLSDMSDIFIEIINLFVEDPDFYNNEDIVGAIFRNFPYYADATKNVRDKIQEEFIGSIGITTNNVVLVMSLMMCLVFSSKIFELFVFSSYYIKITKIVNIFLRINQKEAINELNLDKEILTLLKNPSQSYLHYFFPEKCINKKSINIELEEKGGLASTKKQNKAKLKLAKGKGKKISLFNLRPLSKFRVYVFISLTFIIGIGYYFSNYYFWTITADNVANLLQINTMFNNLYIFSTTALNYQKYYIRENAFDDVQYDNNTNYYQISGNRLNYFFNSFVDRYDQLNDFTTLLPEYGLKAQEFISDTLFDNLIEGDTCVTLEKFGKISDQEFDFCDNIFNGAFKNGLFSMMNQFTLTMSQNPLAPLVNNTVIDQATNKTAEYLKYLKDDSNIDSIIGDYYLSEALYLFYTYIKDYYSTILAQQTLNFQTFVWITCIGFSFLLLVITILTWKYLRNVYIHVSWAMALIPYDKLANDDQTTFLIKQFWKEHN